MLDTYRKVVGIGCDKTSDCFVYVPFVFLFLVCGMYVRGHPCGAGPHAHISPSLWPKSTLGVFFDHSLFTEAEESFMKQ